RSTARPETGRERPPPPTSYSACVNDTPNKASGALLLQAHLSVLRGLGPGVKSSLNQTVNRPRRTAKLSWVCTRKSAKAPEEGRPSSPFAGWRVHPAVKSGRSEEHT